MSTFAAIIPNYNDGPRLGASLASLRAQTIPFDEIIVVDDASTDDSVAIARQAGARLIQNERNLGVVGALNVGLRAARSDFVLLASANDTYAARAVEHAARALADHPDAALLCGNGVIATEMGDRVETRVQLPQRWGFLSPDEVEASARRLTLGFTGGGCFIARAALERAGGLAAELRWHSDWFVHCLLALGRGCSVIPEPIVTISASRSSYSRGVERWPEQRLVTIAFLELLATRFPDELPRFRRAAVLPTYGLRELQLLAERPAFRGYLTPLLVWRCLERLRVALVPAPVLRLGRAVRARL